MAEDPATLWNMEEEEGDLCRVCRSEAEDSKPLIYPCKCSGSVRYVHSDCLQEWLSHSRKRYCEICGHYYTFTKVYPSSLPSAIPVVVYVRQSLFAVGRLAWSIFRICLAIVSWLVFLPFITMLSLRVLLAGANYLTSPSLKYGIHNAILDSYADLNSTLRLNETNSNSTGRERVLAAIATNTTFNITPSFTEQMAADVKNLMAFVFRGQIVAISIAGGLIGLILLREWIGQLDWNARPVVEETEELIPDEWVFRNGHALRFTDHVALSNVATVGESDRGIDFGDNADNETVVDARGDEHGEARHEHVGHRPLALHVEYAAPEQLENGGRARLPPIAPGQTPDWRIEIPHDHQFGPDQLHGQASDWRIEIPDDHQFGPDMPSWLPEVPEDVTTEVGDPGPSTRQHWRHETAGANTADSSEVSDTPQPDPMWSYRDPDQTITPQTITPGNGGFENRRASDPGPGPRTLKRRNTGGEAHANHAGHDDRLGYRPPTPGVAYAGPLPGHEPSGQELWERSPLFYPEDDDANPVDPNTAQHPGSESEAETIHDRAGMRLPLVELVRTDTELEDLDTDGDPEGDGEVDGDGEGDGDGDQDVHAEDEGPLLRAAPEQPEQLLQLELAGLDAMGMEMNPEDDDEHPLDAEDWDGIFEVIGFIGPLTGLLYNHVFVSIAMTCTLLLLVGLPVTIGKLVLIWTDVRMIANVVLGVIRLTAVAVDIVLDIVTSVVRNALIIPFKVAEPAVEWVTSTVDMPQLNLNPAHLSNLLFGHSEQVLSTGTAELPPVVSAVAGPVLNAFELLGQWSYKYYKLMRLANISIAGSSDVVDQFLCLMLGYSCMAGSVVAVAIADAANFVHLSEPVVERARSLAMFLKVVFFMTLEIVIFPLFVGLVMDASTLLLLGCTLESKLERVALHPFGTLFVAWLVGTIFMFSFATFLAHLRTMCRRGALYFIRDPSDPSHSPIKDIIDRPAMTQLPRLATSAVMYSIIAFSVCGAIPTFIVGLSSIGLFKKDFLPLRLDQRPLSSVPFDLLFLHLILPPSWESLRVDHRLKKGLALWWNFTVRSLDLSSLILGVETIRQPQSRAVQLAWLVTDAICQSLFGRYDNRATAARVPSNDRVELLPLTEGAREAMFIPLDHKGAPKTLVDEIRLLRQDRAARRAGRNPMKDYTVIQLPDYWRTRIHVLLGVGLASASFLVAAVFFIPLGVGRLATSFFFEAPVFDGYSWLMGTYVCWASFSFGQSTRKRIIQYSRAARLRRSGTSTRFKRAVLAYLTQAYSVLALYVVLPFLVGFNFELYISLPVRYGFSSDLTPVLHVWDAWAMGAALISVYVGAVGFIGHEDRAGHHVLPRGQRFRDSFRQPMRQKFRFLNSFFLPLALALALPIVIPWCAFLSAFMALNLMGVPVPLYDYTWLFRLSYPLWSCLFVVIFSWQRIKVVVGQIRQWMIDAEYVLEERVENYEPTPEDEAHEPHAKDADIPAALAAVMEGREWEEDDWEDLGEVEAA